jgi:hypothetical protein
LFFQSCTLIQSYSYQRIVFDLTEGEEGVLRGQQLQSRENNSMPPGTTRGSYSGGYLGTPDIWYCSGPRADEDLGDNYHPEPDHLFNPYQICNGRLQGRALLLDDACLDVLQSKNVDRRLGEGA